MAKWLRRQGRGLVVLVALSMLLVVLAIVHPGVPAAKINLNDGGVWVTNKTLRLVGHLNYPSRTLDGGVRAGSGNFDVSQHANTVLLHDDGAGKVQAINNALLTLGAPATKDAAFEVKQSAHTAAVLDGKAGKLWIMAAADIGNFSTDDVPVSDSLVGARLAVGTSGQVAVVLSDGQVKNVRGNSLKNAGAIHGIEDLSTAQVSMVGDQVVVLDRAASTVRTTKGSSSLPSIDRAQLQLSGPEAGHAIVALADAYAKVPLNGGNPDIIRIDAGEGHPTQPAVLGDCTYLAWAGSGQYVRDCGNDADDRRQIVDKIKTGSQLVFRMNRDLIVLNDMVNGSVLMVNENMKHVDNWSPIDSQLKDQEKEDESTQQNIEISAETRKQQQTNPVAVDDKFGARPGRNVELPVLINDSDADGDLLTASVVNQPTGATVSRVRGGEALSIAVPENAAGSYSFTYRVEDGRGGTDEANVTVTVATDSTNEGPKLMRTSHAAVGNGGEVSYPLLTDWHDPEGDIIYLADAVAPAGLEVRFRADGHITIRDLGTGSPGEKQIKVVVSDGRKSTEGVLKVEVKASGNIPPVANNDHVTVLKGQTTVVTPLANDVDANGDDLRLATVQPAGPGQSIVPDYSAGTFSFSSTTVGTVYVLYKVTDGPSATEGWVRIDVIEPANAGPLAADDIAILPSEGSVMAEPLANDTDPSGGVLVVQSVQIPDAARGVAIEIIDHGQLRISAPAGLSSSVTFTYTVANAHGTAQGRVTVMPLPVTSNVEPPNAVDDKAVVRQGDIVTIPVLANDTSPSGQQLTVDPKVTVIGDETAIDAFVSRNTVRVRANKVGTIRLSYTVRDPAGNFDSAQIVVTVTSLSSPNQPPQPKPLVGRVLAGGSTTIAVPTDGIDPDGDSVTLIGVATPPTLGTAVIKNNGIEYSAPEGASGTDTFTYEVQDRFGVKATAAVRVGIAAQAATNQAPVAVPDEVTTRPGRTVNINVLNNDSDPDGDQLGLVADSIKPVDASSRATAKQVGGSIEVTTPSQEGVYRFYYEVTDGKGGTARGVATVKTRNDAPLRAPVARDDIVALADIQNNRAEVDVLANDYDPDGAVKDLKLSIEGGATIRNGKVVVSVTDQRQVILYTLTDMDGLTGRGAIVVPAANALAPYLNPAKSTATVKAGQTLTIPLDDYVIVRAGHRPLLTFAAKVKAGPGASQTALVKDNRTLQFQANEDYVGLSSLTFEVTDGSSAEDPNGLSSVLTLPIKVESSGLHPPIFRPSAVSVAAGEPAITTDLKQMVTDEDPGDIDKMRFSLGAVSPGFQVSLNGSTLSVSAPADAKAGTRGNVAISVTDGRTPAVTGTIPVTVTASTRPLMVVSPVTINDAKAGEARTVDLAQYITNPFATEGKPITLVGQPTVSVGQGTATMSGLKVTVTPQADFHGQMVVSYTAADATNDPSRYVNGRITLTVRARPDAPTGVSAETTASRTATVRWTAGASNGADITDFIVRWSGGSKKCGQTTQCTITTLTNDVTYSFTVVAVNAVGESDPSAPSNSVRPDVRPNQPGTPVGTFGDRQISLTWPETGSDGSRVTSYTVETSPASGAAQRTVTTNAAVITGLTNGTSYSFRVRAHSAASEPSEWSGWSVPVVPVGLPGQPAAPQVTKDPVSAANPSATVRWTAPNANGDPVLSYEVRRVNGNVVYTGTNVTTHVLLNTGSNESFQVRARNKAGWGPWSTASAPVRAWQVPGAVTNLSATPTGNSNEVKISFGPAPGNGALPSEMTYFWSANGVTGSISSTGGVVRNSTAFPNGRDVKVSVYAVATVQGEKAAGVVTSTSVNAYGPPIAPNVSCSAVGTTINCSWSGADNGGRPTTYYYGGNLSGVAPASGVYSFVNVGYNVTRQVCIEARQDGGSTSKKCDSATTPAAPPSPAVIVTAGDRHTSATCGSIYCRYVMVETRNFSSNVRCSLTDSLLGGGWVSDWTQGPSEIRVAGSGANAHYGYPGETITVTCNGVSGSVVWPR